MRIVALFARAWIEIADVVKGLFYITVALFARAWIEMVKMRKAVKRL